MAEDNTTNTSAADAATARKDANLAASKAVADESKGLQGLLGLLERLKAGYKEIVDTVTSHLASEQKITAEHQKQESLKQSTRQKSSAKDSSKQKQTEQKTAGEKSPAEKPKKKRQPPRKAAPEPEPLDTEPVETESPEAKTSKRTSKQKSRKKKATGKKRSRKKGKGSVWKKSLGGGDFDGGDIGSTLGTLGVKPGIAGAAGFGIEKGLEVKKFIDETSDRMDDASLEAQGSIRNAKRDEQKHRLKVATTTGVEGRTELIEENKDEADDLTERIDKRSQEISKLKKSWSGMAGGNSSQIAVLEGQNEIDEQKKSKLGAENKKQEAERKKDAAEEIEYQTARAHGDVGKVKAIEEKREWVKDYNGYVGQFGIGNEQDAAKAAEQKFQGDKLEREKAASADQSTKTQALGSGLANARTGGAATAGSGGGPTGGGCPCQQAIEALHATVKAQGEAVTRKNFSKQ